MIDHKEEKPLYSSMKIARHPNDVLLIYKGLKDKPSETVGQITIKDDFEKNLWMEAIQKINEILKSLNKS